MQRIVAALAAAVVFVTGVNGDEPKKPTKLSAESAKTAGDSLDKAIAYFRANQGPNGSFAPGDRFDMGITGLAVTGILRSKRVTAVDPMISKAMSHLESFVQPSGGIYPKSMDGQANYMTCIGLMAFVEANKDRKYQATIDKAVGFLKGMQWSEEAKGKAKVDAKNKSYGGFGYGQGSRPDLSNTSFTLEALNAAGVSKDDESIKRAVTFLRRCQSFSGEGGNDQLKEGAATDGGFGYTPDAGTRGAAEGTLRTYGSMTYAGFKSFIYAGLSKDDPRVKAALQWISKNYSVDENPGQGKSGLFYYYSIFSKALAAAQLEKVSAKGADHDWRTDVIKALAASQKADGTWVNSNKQFQEGDQRLCTAFAILSIAQAIE